MAIAQQGATRDCVPVDDGRTALVPLAWRPVGAVTAVAGALLLAMNGGYGYHRDELYFLMLRPAWAIGTSRR